MHALNNMKTQCITDIGTEFPLQNKKIIPFQSKNSADEDEGKLFCLVSPNVNSSVYNVSMKLNYSVRQN